MKFLCRFLVLMVVFNSYSFCPCQARDEIGTLQPRLDTSAPSGSKVFLKGSLEHAEQLPALSNSQQSGAHFSEKSVGNRTPTSVWFAIPDWFAGTFAIEESTILSIHDYATGKDLKANKTVRAAGQEFRGYQADRKGSIWQYSISSGNSSSDQDTVRIHNIIDWFGPVFIDKNLVVMRILATSMVVDKNSGTIVDSYRREDLKRYSPLGNGKLKVQYTSKSFDSRGFARDLQSGVAVHQRIAAFRPIDELDGVDYRKLFIHFLESTGRRDLVP